jgi:tetratricopeptide (TPR) repeat protein
MKYRSVIMFLTLLATIALHTGVLSANSPQPAAYAYAGSASCRECHERFHTLWNTSRHRDTIRPYSDDFAKNELLPQKDAITIGAFRYLADISPGAGRITETGANGVKSYRIEQVLGGKGLYSFLTTLEDGRIESLPLGYDKARKEWYEAENGVDAPAPDGGKKSLVYWKNYPFVFSEACPSCHVSRFSITHDPAQKKYTESWSEPGINCETCHGPAAEHNRAMRNVPKWQPVTDPKLISVKKMSPARRSDLCATCHAKQTALTTAFTPGERYFDHYELTTLENNEFYPDGRDQGENYTLTGWLMNKCVKDGTPDCVHCHTSSGRYRFASADKANNACLPCHAERVKNVASHSHHKADGAGSRCVSCHMPKTTFARMTRSDHSMRPPSPAATMEFKSPNACNICHTEKDAAWADKVVREWYPGGYQDKTLKPARLIAAARKQEWTKLPEMLALIQSKGRDEVFAASLLKMLRWCTDERVAPVLISALHDRSPLVRAAAAEALGQKISTESATALLAAAQDDYRVVRIKAAASLANFPNRLLPKGADKDLQRANGEYNDSILMEPDKWRSWLIVGNNHLRREEFREALDAYQRSLAIKPESVQTLLNQAYAWFKLDDTENAGTSLVAALKIEPDNASAQAMAHRFSFGPAALAMAERYFAAMVKAEPASAPAAFGLCMTIAPERQDEAINWCRAAVKVAPGEKKYAKALERKLGQSAKALKPLILIK